MPKIGLISICGQTVVLGNLAFYCYVAYVAYSTRFWVTYENEKLCSGKNSDIFHVCQYAHPPTSHLTPPHTTLGKILVTIKANELNVISDYYK